MSSDEMMELRECPPGPFLFNGSLGFKTEYAEEIPAGSKKWWPGAYCMESGEFFWGGVSTHEERAKLMVQPVEVAVIPRGE